MNLYSQDAEASVVGAALLKPDLIADLSEAVRPEDFGYIEYRIIWSAVINMARRGEEIDAITVSEYLASSGTLDDVGGLAAISEMARSTPSTDNAGSYAGIVADLAQRRALIAMLPDCEQAIAERDKPVDEIVTALQGRLESTRRKTRQRLLRAAEYLPTEFADPLDRKFNGQEESMGVSYGLRDLDKNTMGMKPNELVVVGGRPSMGKAQPLDAKVLTRRGWKLMGEIQIGDELASVDGKLSFVTGVFPQGVKDIYEVAFSDGRSTRACAEHLWSVTYRDWDGPRVVSTAKLIDMLGKKRYQNRLWIDVYRGDHGHDETLPLHPWVVGAMIANGNVTDGTPRISTGDPENLDKLIELMGGAVSPTPDGDCSYRLKGVKQKNALADGLKQIGMWGCLSYEKRVPAAYLEAPKSDRIDLLAGLIDNDGWVEKFGAVLYSTSSRGLAEDVQYLVRSLGGVCNIATKEPAYRGKEGERLIGRTHYTCTICLPCFDGVVTLPRKLERIGAKKSNRQKRINVASIRLVSREQAQCISVSHDRHLYVTDDFIVTHNTAFMMNTLRAALRGDKPILVESLEMKRPALFNRLVAGMGGFPIAALQDPQNNGMDEYWTYLSAPMLTIKNSDLYINDETPRTISQIRAQVKEIHDRHGSIGLVMIDYLGKVKVEGDYGLRHDRAIEEVVTGAKAIAKEFNCPVMLLSQLNRKLEERPNKRPNMGDLKDSSAIEQEADTILFLYRDEVYNKDNPNNKGLAEIIIAKQREGITDTVHVVSRLSHARFEDLAPSYYAEEAS
ncbi:DnaB-like helicase C-terminal domain-containing protein [Salinicola peritrichatus]|uniref:DnaB-like helicase C-terminal domain-containing protein n=1 Tax=Salinicola peritrichatus TaxID=1267424 RepID=UPI000DA1F097|nr:DnaB-like helicase C-terminal domain-containing protein [Salinicola peritrichatus]